MKGIFALILLCFSLAVVAQGGGDRVGNGSPPYCPNGTVVGTGYDSRGCQNPPACVKPGQCAEYSMPLCARGETVVSLGQDTTGCSRGPVCVNLSKCPNYSPPMCEGGRIVVPGKSKNGCDKAPVCVMPVQCPEF